MLCGATSRWDRPKRRIPPRSISDNIEFVESGHRMTQAAFPGTSPQVPLVQITGAWTITMCGWVIAQGKGIGRIFKAPQAYRGAAMFIRKKRGTAACGIHSSPSYAPAEGGNPFGSSLLVMSGWPTSSTSSVTAITLGTIYPVVAADTIYLLRIGLRTLPLSPD